MPDELLSTPEAENPLSPREAESLELLANGLNRPQAAARMKISAHTVRVYIESARHKLGAKNTLQAVARATRRGFIKVEVSS